MKNETEKPEFWEAAFSEKQEMWGLEPATSALLAKDIFIQHAVQSVLVPGIGYGRNAKVFTDNGMSVTGIEISKTAIELARNHFGSELTIYHGSVTDMPFDDRKYDGIFCYALIHLLERDERAKLICDCYSQLTEGGMMIFTVISKAAPTFGQGKPIGTDQYELFGGVRMFFYDKASINAEFGQAGLVEITEVTENYPFYLIQCKKEGL